MSGSHHAGNGSSHESAEELNDLFATATAYGNASAVAQNHRGVAWRVGAKLSHAREADDRRPVYAYEPRWIETTLQRRE